MLNYADFRGVKCLEDAAKNDPWIAWGAQGIGVAKLQKAFVRLGYPMPGSTKAGGEMDGIFGNEMYKVTCAYQGDKKTLKKDGAIGKNTMSALDADMVAKTTPPLKPKPPPVTPKPNKPKLPPFVPTIPVSTIAKFDDRDDYNLMLIESKGAYRLHLTMTIKFTFVDGDAAAWTDQAEKIKFANDWASTVEKAWSLSNLYTSKKYGRVPFFVDIFRKSSGDAEWKVTVTKIPAGTWRESTVTNGNVNTCQFDSGDFDPKNKGASMKQRGAVHEFGHMIGLPDENPTSAPAGNTWGTDKDSMMHSGEVIRARHHEAFRKFVKDYFGE